jgi:CheY-like chemotaxis protein
MSANSDTAGNPARKCALLVVEDNRADVVLLRRALAAAGIACDIAVARDGQEAIDYLNSNARAVDTSFHLLVDLKLPRMSGLELLAWVRNSDAFCKLPVIVLTSSNLESDIEQARGLGIDAYLIKPGSMPEFVETATQIGRIWGLASSPKPTGF